MCYFINLTYSDCLYKCVVFRSDHFKDICAFSLVIEKS